MDLTLTGEQQAIRDAVARLCADFAAEYWLEKDSSGDFPHEFHAAMAAAGWLGIAMPTEYGGAGPRIIEAGLLMRGVAPSGARVSGASGMHMDIFRLQPVGLVRRAPQ